MPVGSVHENTLYPLSLSFRKPENQSLCQSTSAILSAVTEQMTFNNRNQENLVPV